MTSIRTGNKRRRARERRQIDAAIIRRAWHGRWTHPHQVRVLRRQWPYARTSAGPSYLELVARLIASKPRAVLW